MNRTGASAVALLSLLLASPLAAQPARELRGQVFHLGENGEKVSEPGLIVTLVATGATDDTNDQGMFRLPLPPALQPGDSVTLSIDKPGWRIRYPLDGEARLPRELRREIVPIELLQAGSKLFWTHDRIEKFIRDASESSKREGTREDDPPSLDLGREIKDWAARYGFSAREAREEIDRWIADVEAAHENSYQKGLAAFAQQQFDAAAERFRDSAEWRIRQLDEIRRQQEKLEEKAERLQEEVVRDLRLQGDSHYYAYRYQQALTVYEQAHRYTSQDRTPQLWAAALNDIGRAHEQLGILVAAPESTEHLAAAAQAYRQALLVHTREQTPRDWAATQNHLGDALAHRGLRTAGNERAEILGEAIQAHRQALLVFTREQTPKDWARSQYGLGNALLVQEASAAGKEKAELVEQAVQAYRQALLVYTREHTPQDWGYVQNSLGNALCVQSRWPDKNGAQLLAEAAQAYRQALLVFTREQLPQEWARAQSNLGNALREQGTRTAGQEGLQLLAQAVEAYRQALLVRTREHTAQAWAITQNSLGLALREQGKRTEGKAGGQLLAEAAQAHQQALLVFTREHTAQYWAINQHNLGEALQEQGKRASGEEGAQLLAQAVDAYRKSLLVFTLEHFPGYWSSVHFNEAKALLALRRQEEAVEILSQVLAKAPDRRQAFELLGTTLNNRLFRHPEAVALTRSWLSRNPDDLPARLVLGEQLFASRAFSESSQETASLLKKELSPEKRIVALGYAIAAGLVTDSPEVPERIEELLGVVTAQPQDFKTSWIFEGTLHSLGQDPEPPHKDLLIRLFQTLEAPDRDSLLKGLRDIKEAVPIRRAA